MERYDVIIVGAGIAGTSLAYNLSQECPEKRVLLIDKKSPGANAAYGYRSTTEDTVKKYKLPYEHIYKGINVGMGDEVAFVLKKNYYLLNYRIICKNFLKKSQVEFRNEEAIKQEGNFLETNKNRYSFQILVDCSGHNFFVKKIHKHKIPFRYFIGKTRVLKNKLKNKNFIYYQFSDSNYVGEIYPLKNKTLQADWYYVKKVNFNNINPPDKTIYKKYIPNPEIIQEINAVIPCTPVLPLFYKNIAFLGNSFGNSTTSSASGTHTILNTSLMLTEAIKKNNLNIYEKNWKKRYLDIYIKHLVTKYDTYHNSKFLQWLKKTPKRSEQLPTLSKYPYLFAQIWDGESNLKIPSEMKKIYPKRAVIVQFYYYLYLKLKYAFM